MWEKRNANRVFVRKLEGEKKDSMGYLDAVEKIILKLILREQDRKKQSGFTWNRPEIGFHELRDI